MTTGPGPVTVAPFTTPVHVIVPGAWVAMVPTVGVMEMPGDNVTCALKVQALALGPLVPAWAAGTPATTSPKTMTATARDRIDMTGTSTTHQY